MEKTKLTIDEIAELNPEAMMADGFDDALIGIDQVNYVAVYDVDKCIEILVETSSMTFKEAEEFFEFNTLNAYVGEYTPRFVKVYNRI